MDYITIFYFLFPIVSVYIVSSYFPVSKSAGQNVSFRPPPYAFAIVWPILLLLLGYSWTLRQGLSLLYFILTVLISAWSPIFTFSAVSSLYQIIATTLFTIFLIFYKFDSLSSYLLIPLVVWLTFASVLNYYSIV